MTRRVNLSSSGKLTLKSTALIPGVVYYRIYNSTGEQLWEQSYQANSSGQSSINEEFDLTKGTYYLGVEQDWSSAIGDYSLKLLFQSAEESFSESENENNNTIATADDIADKNIYKGQLAKNDDKDFYRFTLKSSGKIRLQSAALIPGVVYYRIYNGTGEQLWEQPYQANSSGQSSINEEFDLTKGTYYLGVERDWSSATGNYSLKLSFQSAGESFTETGNGNNNTIATADSIAEKTTYKGQLAKNDNKDFYRFTIKSSGKIQLQSISLIQEGVYYRIYNSTGEELWSQYYQTNNSGQCRINEILDLKKGTYYLGVEQNWSGSTGNYSFKLSSVIPQINSVSNTSSGVKIIWSKIPETQYYCIFYKTGSGNWKKLTDTTSTSYIWKKAKSGTTYIFTVRCLSSDAKSYTSGYDTRGKSIKRLAQPKISKFEANNSGLKIAWGKIAGASKYRVYYKTAAGWKKIKETAGTSCTIKATLNKNYTYTVRAFSGSYSSSFNSTGNTFKRVATPKLGSISNVKGGVKISWGKVKGAAKYRVYYKTGNGEWKKLADTSATSYTWKKAKKGTTYMFTVRCIDRKASVYTSGYNTVGKKLRYIGK